MENKKYKDMTREEKEKFLKNAKKVGAATAITGAGTLGASYLLGDSEALRRYAGDAVKLGGKNSRRAKFVGTAATATGLGIYGVAKYKHHKLKKEDDNSKK